jgi:hypothetical protein
MTVKERVIQTVQELPYDISIEDVIERLYLLYKIERGIEQANLGQKLSQDEAKKRIRE